jgi:hypothetical protein
MLSFRKAECGDMMVPELPYSQVAIGGYPSNHNSDIACLCMWHDIATSNIHTGNLP